MRPLHLLWASYWTTYLRTLELTFRLLWKLDILHSTSEDSYEASWSSRTKEVDNEVPPLLSWRRTKVKTNNQQSTQKNQTPETPAMDNINHQATSDATKSVQMQLEVLISFF